MQSLLAKLGAKPFLSIAILGLILFLSGTWIAPLIDRDEPRFAEASREMLRSGDWVIPRLNNQYRFDKPPMIYWAQATCYRALGENAFAARLPTVIFATATGLLLVLWGRRLGNPKAGFWAGLMLITCLQMLVHGRMALADMPMVLFVTLSIWCGWEMTRPQAEQRTFWWWMFYITLALGFLAKGPVALLPLGGVMLGRWLRPHAFYLSWARMLPGLLVTLALIGLWGIPALVATHGKYYSVGIGHHVIDRSIGVMEGHGGKSTLAFVAALPLYFLTFFLSFFPWAFRMPKALKAWWPTRQEDSLGWYLLVQAALVFAVFTLVRTKLPHYTLPAFPCLALWLALYLTRQSPEVEKGIAKGAAAMCVVALLLTLGLFSALQSHFLAFNLARQIRPYAKPEMQLATASFTEPSLVWEFRRDSTNFMQYLAPEQVEGFLKTKEPFVLVVSTEDFNQRLKPLVATNDVILQMSGINTVNLVRKKPWNPSLPWCGMLSAENWRDALLWDMTAIVRQ